MMINSGKASNANWGMERAREAREMLSEAVEKKVWYHGKIPSLGGETGGWYLMLGPME